MQKYPKNHIFGIVSMKKITFSEHKRHKSISENAVPFGIIFTKADKLGRGRLSENVKKLLDTLSE